MYCQHLDFWSEPSSFADTIFLRVSPKQSDLVDKLLTDAGIPHEVVVSDLQRSVGVVCIQISCHYRPNAVILNLDSLQEEVFSSLFIVYNNSVYSVCTYVLTFLLYSMGVSVA